MVETVRKSNTRVFSDREEKIRKTSKNLDTK